MTMQPTIENEEELVQPEGSLVAGLPVISAKDQADKTLDNSSSVTQSAPESDTGDRFENRTKGSFPGATSRVDLSVPANVEAMDKEYENWWYAPKGEQRDIQRNDWYLKYHGIPYEDYNQQRKDANFQAANPLRRLDNIFQTLSVPGTAWADFGMDALGVLPGMAPVDDIWDEKTRFSNPVNERIRKALSVILPAIYFGKMTTPHIMGSTKTLPWAQKLAARAGLYTLEDAALMAISDQGEEDNMFRALSDLVPGLFGPKGWLPIPNAIKTLDADSPAVRKRKNMYDSGVFAGLGSIIGGTLSGLEKATRPKGKGAEILGWFEDLDGKSAAYKTDQIIDAADADKLIRLQEIETQIALGSENYSRQVFNQLVDESEALKQDLKFYRDIDDAIRQAEESKQAEKAQAARTSDTLNPDSKEFDVRTSELVDETENITQSVPPGNVARNMADTTAIKAGVSEGDPAPIITEAMRRKGLMVGSTSRDAVMGVAEEGRDIGRFNALVDGFRFTTKQMNAAAWDIYTSIIAANNMDEVRDLFLKNKDVKSMLLGKFNVEYINEEQARAAAFAMRDLVDRFLGREIAQSSARVMDTLGRESNSLAEAMVELKGFTNNDAAMDLILDKMQFLMDEYALNKYISGWQLRNKNWFDNVPPKDIDTVIKTLQEEFVTAENAVHAKNLKFTEELRRLKKENPLAMRPLVDAFAHTNGDVDSLAKLMKWAADQVTPTGMLKSPDPKQLNLFTRSAWGVIYNNVLSGISAFRAGIGNTGQLILKPITSLLGHGIFGFTDEFEGLKRTLYYNGAVFETNRRAMSDAWKMMKKANNDPEALMQSFRKDFVFQEDASWNIMDDMRSVWEQEGNTGRIMQLDMAKTMRDMSKMKALRYGMTGMVFTDVFAQVHLAHYVSRMRAYDDVFHEFGFADWKKIAKAERKHYETLFDANGLIDDKALKALSGEVALNLDDATATWINKATTAYPVSKFMLMFPRTGSNWVKNAISWTPLQAIPGINKYSKTIWARTDEDIAAALAEHGIDMATTPNARELWKNLRAEYVGRMAFSSIMTKVMWDYSMAGNIRGNGHYNAGQRQKERTQFGYEPKTINIAGKWVSYKGIPMVDPILSILGDMAYYARDLDQPFMEDAQAKVMWTISASFLNETPLQGLEPLVAAANGDLSGWSRLVANSARSMIPMSGAAGVLSNAITSSQKDIDANIIKYIQNKTPIASSFLPEQIDIWTGQPVNDVDNPFLRILNALSPIKISGTREPWRVWLQEIGWNGISRLKKDSSGSYTYSEEEREIIYKYIGEMQLYKQLIPLMNSKAYKESIGKLRAHRVTNNDLENVKIQLDADQLPVFQEINSIIRAAQKIAEQRLLAEHPEIAQTINYQQEVKGAMKQGKVDEAHNLQKEELEKRKLLQFGGSR